MSSPTSSPPPGTACTPLPPPPPHIVAECTPGAPHAVETASTALSLAWAPITCVVHGHSAGVEFVILYELQMQQVDNKKALHPDRWSVQYVGAASFVHVKGLMPGTQYCCRVIAVPSVTNGNAEVSTSLPSETTLVETLPCPPKGQPMPQLASRLKKELKFKWAEPEETGGRPLQYRLQMSPAPDGWHGQPEAEFCTVHLGPERVYLARRLLPGQRYRVRVKAINCEGESAWSPEAVVCTQAAVPSWALSDAPFVCDTTAASVVLGWPEPNSNGGAVTGYEVEMDDGSGFRYVARSVERQCTIQGLCSGIVYRFRVRAENEAGRSVWSSLGEGRTAAVPPGACTSPTILGASQTSAMIRWEEPANGGGSPILCYQVEVRPHCAAARCGVDDEFREWAVRYQGSERACTVGGLRAGCVYLTRVRAVTQAGAGTFSAAATLQTAPGTPGCPGLPAATARHQTGLTVEWSPPQHDGGSPVSAYRLESCCLGSMEGAQGVSDKGKAKRAPLYELAHLGPVCCATLAGLEPGFRYALRCSAINDQGSSGWGPTAHVETLPGLPFPVDSLQLVATASTIFKLRWSQPYGRGAAVTGYVLELAMVAPSQSAVAPPARPWATEPAETFELPGANGGQAGRLAGDNLRRGDNQDSAASIDTNYRPAYSGPNTSCTVRGLQPNTDYSFRVWASNSVGSSVSEQTTFRTAPAAPACPWGLEQHHPTPCSLSISWQHPATDHGAPVASYQLECLHCGNRPAKAAPHAWKLVYEGPRLDAEADGLLPGRHYRVRVRASNICGWGPWSEPLPCTTAPGVPGPPPMLAAKAVGTSVRAAWEAAEDNGAIVLAYELEMASVCDGRFATVFRGESLSHRVQQLDVSAAYHFRVRAENAVGPGPYSSLAFVQTSKAPPPPPAAVQAHAAESGCSASCIGVSWSASQPGPHEAACISYEVEASTGTASSTVRHSCPGRDTQAALSGLTPGATYFVRVRGVGADGAGHGVWTVPVKVGLAKRTAAAAEPPAARGEADARVQRRRDRGDSVQQPRARTAARTVVGRGPPKKGIQVSVARFIRQHVVRLLVSPSNTLAQLIGLFFFLLIMVLLRVVLPPAT